jgi:broad specificity phosphatase PhoE
LGRWLRDRPVDEQPTVALCSPYRRAAATAETVVERSGLDLAVTWDERLRERDLGMFDGLTGTGIRTQFPEEATRRRRTGKFYYRPPGGESWCDVALRVRSFLRDLCAEHHDDRVMIATHPAVILNFRFLLEGLTEAQLMDTAHDVPLANCSVTSYRRQPQGTLTLVTVNDVTALESLGEPVTEEAGRHVEA